MWHIINSDILWLMQQCTSKTGIAFVCLPSSFDWEGAKTFSKMHKFDFCILDTTTSRKQKSLWCKDISFYITCNRHASSKNGKSLQRDFSSFNSKGTDKNYVDHFLPNFDHLPTSGWHSYYVSLLSNSYILITTYLLPFLNIVFGVLGFWISP